MIDWWLRLRLPAEARSYGTEILGGGVYQLARPWWHPSGRAGGRDSTTDHVRVVSYVDFTGTWTTVIPCDARGEVGSETPILGHVPGADQEAALRAAQTICEARPAPGEVDPSWELARLRFDLRDRLGGDPWAPWAGATHRPLRRHWAALRPWATPAAHCRRMAREAASSIEADTWALAASVLARAGVA